jgi:hypothetical protein
MLMVEIILSLFVTAAIIVSRKLMNMGRKFCSFVYYVKLINTELWMAEEAMTLNGDGESRTVEGRIRRRIRKQCREVFLFSSSILRDGRFDLS